MHYIDRIRNDFDIINLRKKLLALHYYNVPNLSDEDVVHLVKRHVLNGEIYLSPLRHMDKFKVPPHATLLAQRTLKPLDWKLGQLSARYESGNRGPSAVSTGIGDVGGVSYGTYQMTSKPNGGTVRKFVTSSKFPWRSQFEKLVPGSKEFTKTWKELSEKETIRLASEEHDFIKSTHYDLLISAIKKDCYVDITERTHALQDVAWSISVQHGSKTKLMHVAIHSLAIAPQTITRNLEYDRDIIIATYNERGRTDENGTMVYFKRNNKEIQKGICQRYKSELSDALYELDSYK